jgi:hypothetical protein
MSLNGLAALPRGRRYVCSFGVNQTSGGLAFTAAFDLMEFQSSRH